MRDSAVPERSAGHVVASRDDVGDQLIPHGRDLVAQPQLAALQPGDLHLVGHRTARQRRDGVVEVAMLDAQHFDLSPDIRFVHRTPRKPRFSARRRKPHGPSIALKIGGRQAGQSMIYSMILAT